MAGVASAGADSAGSMTLVAYLAVPLLGSLLSLLGVPAAIAARRTSSAWVARGLLLGVAGAFVALAGAGVAVVGAGLRMWWMIPATLVVLVSSRLLLEQVPGEQKRRGLERSVSGWLARAGWWLSGRRHRRAIAELVRIERSKPSAAVYTLAQIRQELVGPILEAADHDFMLNLTIDEIADQIEAAVLEVTRTTAGQKNRRTTARSGMTHYAGVSDFAASVLAQATEPAAHRTVRRFGPYSATMLKLAAACRLVERAPAGVPLNA